jgi:iron complex transport system substrate-binding protein
MFRILIASSLLALTACGASTPSSTPQASGGPFPVTVEHKYGSTTVNSEPKRIVVVGLTEQDPLLALGVVPVATTDWLKKYPNAINPWSESKMGNAERPTLLTDGGSGPQFEKIAALRPDLILGLYAGLTQEQYTTLGKIAPTVAQPKGYNDYGVPWQEATKTIGKLVGRSAQADQLVADVEAKFAKVRQDNPKFASSTTVIATTWDGYFVYGSQDPRSRTLAAMGFKLPANLDEVIDDKFGASISKERVDLLDQSVVVWLAPTAKQLRATLDADALYSGLNVAKEKRDVLLDETTQLGNAASFVSVLSLPYVLDNLTPQLAAAVK